MANIAVLGMGLLGAGFAESLLGMGHAVRVWNRTASKCRPLGELGAAIADSAAEAVADADRVHLVLSEDLAVDAVLQAIGPSLPAGVPVLDHSTNLPVTVAARAARLGKEGVNYLHAPVFMSPAAARGATGLMLIAGPEASVEPLRGALEAMTGRLWHVGEAPDKAATIKLAGNGLMVALAATMGDLYRIAENNGLAAADVLELFESFSPTPVYLGNRVVAAGTKPASFELTMARKDTRLMIEAAGGPHGLSVLPAVVAAMDRAIEAGHGAEDYAIFAKV